MSYTFGASGADDITVTLANNQIGANNAGSMFVGWFYPTTLTAGRFYCSAGSTNIGVSVDAATDELLVTTRNATTDGQWATTGADITVNKWWFIAVLLTCNNTGPAGGVRVWVGDEFVLNEVTVTETVAPVGTYTGQTARYIGNNGTSAALAFQGDVGWMSILSNGNVGTTSMFALDAAGVITDGQAAINLNRWVRPLWLGRPDLSPSTNAAAANSWSILHMPLDESGLGYVRSSDATTVNSPVPLTINGATFMSHAPPRKPPENWPVMHPYLRRAA